MREQILQRRLCEPSSIVRDLGVESLKVPLWTGTGNHHRPQPMGRRGRAGWRVLARWPRSALQFTPHFPHYARLLNPHRDDYPQPAEGSGTRRLTAFFVPGERRAPCPNGRRRARVRDAGFVAPATQHSSGPSGCACESAWRRVCRWRVIRRLIEIALVAQRKDCLSRSFRSVELAPSVRRNRIGYNFAGGRGHKLDARRTLLAVLRRVLILGLFV